MLLSYDIASGALLLKWRYEDRTVPRNHSRLLEAFGNFV
jgi:hypothetical protein